MYLTSLYTEYMAPEMLSGQGYGRSADYWSLGCIAYEMLAGLPPFKSKDGRKELFRRIMSEKVKMPSGSTAEACKLLKGLLNRNVQKRLGAAKSTMFEVGGVAALKNEPFFGHLNWEHLANRQVEPPQVLTVQNDQDLKHFHQEFTDMALPRSVVLMSKENFPVHHVESQRFRGFSFIHDSFDLPERPDSELESYWKSIEEDALSLSDCASSKMANDADEQPSSDSPIKKRPPRKRKKNKNDASFGTPVASTHTSPAPSVVATPAPSENFRRDEVVPLEQEENATQKFAVEQQEKCLAQTPPESARQEKTKVAVNVEDWQNVGESSSKSDRQRSSANNGTPNRGLAKTPITQEPSKPSWLTTRRPQTSNDSPWNHSKQTGARGKLSETIPLAQPIPPSLPLEQPIPSSDWRYHPMSSRRQTSAEQQQQSEPPSQPTWPSLGGKQENHQPSLSKFPPSTSRPALQGAWASKAAR